MDKSYDDCQLRMEHISKSFAGVKALDEVSLYVRRGEVHALMGENGAGKSTLMKILTGIIRPDDGSIFIRGKLAGNLTPGKALACGISMIHQELNPVMYMTVAENIFLGREPVYPRMPVVNKKKELESTRIFFQEMDMDIHPGTLMSRLSIAQIQMVEIIKAVSYNSGILIMDEPTSAITDREVNKLFDIIRKLRSGGVSIIYISHKMGEIFNIADTITVLRDGKHIDTRPAAALNSKELIRLMVGREISTVFPERQAVTGPVSLEVQAISRKGKFQNISFEAHAGEILGFAGLMGAGRTEIMESIFGINRYDSGKLIVQHKAVLIRSPADAVKSGMALITEDRKKAGLNLKGSVKTNTSLASLKDYCSFGQILNADKEKKSVDLEIKRLGIKTVGRNQLVNTLSGGNQQKVVLAKWFLTNPDILILDEPTRGIDVNAKTEIYQLVSQLAQQGKTILLISSEMPELLGLCDRIIVIYQGCVQAIFKKNEFNAERIMEAAMGIPSDIHNKGSLYAV
ncbi:MAG: sugar ABC transporter ATP-binding protein [Puia sp.]